MSDNYLGAIEKLTGRENYSAWKFPYENILKLRLIIHRVNLYKYQL